MRRRTLGFARPQGRCVEDAGIRRATRGACVRVRDQRREHRVDEKPLVGEQPELAQHYRRVAVASNQRLGGCEGAATLERRMAVRPESRARTGDDGKVREQ